MKIEYPAIYTFDKENKIYNVNFIDFDCSTSGKTINEASIQAEAAMNAYFAKNDVVPKATKNRVGIELGMNQFIDTISRDITM